MKLYKEQTFSLCEHPMSYMPPRENICAATFQFYSENGLPTAAQPWQLSGHRSIGKDRSNHHALSEAMQQAVLHSPWRWPERTVFFLTDPHADALAFVSSLLASGGIRKNGDGLCDFELTETGREAVFVIGGDCLDKGPDNLQLLRCVRQLMNSGARVKLLAGNHDVRLLMGLRAMQLPPDPTTEHFFIRMEPKIVPLLKEIHALYLSGKDALHGVPDRRECRRLLYPCRQWFDEFPREAVWLMPESGIQRELQRMRYKVDVFEEVCHEAGLSLRDVYATARKCQQLFLQPQGEYAWFFREMQLLYREGSFLFIHAGLDDRISSLIEEQGIDYLNRLFREQIQHNLFEFYYGPLANTMRTKYRGVDMPLTRHGVERIYRQGLHAIVHGHRNLTQGQRIMLRQGMIHIECDITMDENSRAQEGLQGNGVGVTLVRPQGQVVGISKDYPYAKVFEPEHYFSPESVSSGRIQGV
ncbi:MAG: metallophosphoesterase [gamma proteobacterium symbiont of Bathyaustriella thionipta]|nr:metallophosphoesterase [gamma proteobacterium symbiont of Bathyaustriella thionipta]